MYQPQSPYYDPYTASRRPDYMPFGPNQQFYQPIYQPSYAQFSPFGYGQAPFGGFYQPPMMGMMGRGRGLQMGGQRMGMAPRGMFTNYGDMFGGQATYLTEPRAMDHGMLGGAPINYELPTGPEATFQPMRPPMPVQTQYRPIPYMTQSQIDARQNMFGNPGGSIGATPSDGGGGGYGDGGIGGGPSSAAVGGGYSGPGSVGPEGATSTGGMGPGDSGVGVGMGADSDGAGVFKGGGRVRKQNYGGIDALLRK
jgi:hypothetical protein